MRGPRFVELQREQRPSKVQIPRPDNTLVSRVPIATKQVDDWELHGQCGRRLRSRGPLDSLSPGVQGFTPLMSSAVSLATRRRKEHLPLTVLWSRVPHFEKGRSAGTRDPRGPVPSSVPGHASATLPRRHQTMPCAHNREAAPNGLALFHATCGRDARKGVLTLPDRASCPAETPLCVAPAEKTPSLRSSDVTGRSSNLRTEHEGVGPASPPGHAAPHHQRLPGGSDRSREGTCHQDCS